VVIHVRYLTTTWKHLTTQSAIIFEHDLPTVFGNFPAKIILRIKGAPVDGVVREIEVEQVEQTVNGEFPGSVCQIGFASEGFDLRVIKDAMRARGERRIQCVAKFVGEVC
jgi:hypothetical protein